MADFELLTAWRRDDPRHIADAKAYWERTGLVVNPEKREQRASELCVVGYDDGQLVGDSTAQLVVLPGLRQRFAMIRVSVDPMRRQTKLAGQLVARTKDVLEKWSAAHPEEKVMGMAAALTARELAEKQRDPLWADYGVYFVLVGYMPTGEQVRVSWFRHARV